jgi:hypothetical protein
MRWLVVILLGVVAACLLVQLGYSIAQAQPAGVAKGGNVFAVAGQVDKETYGLYLVDLDNGTICVYQYLPGDRKLRLMAARTTVFDRRLEDYNTQPPPPEIRKLVEEHKSLSGAATRP